MYWMALTAIPAIVIDKPRRLSYNFLWSGSSDHSRQHLCNWESLAKPKIKGGWGIKNIFHFSKALVVNSLWRVLTKPCIWHSVIKDKHLLHTTIVRWLRNATATTRVASKFWRNLAKSKFWLTQWLCWKPGSGHSIILSNDCILDLDKASYLPPQLIAHLNTKKIHLFQARGSSRSGFISDRWIASAELELNAEHAFCWENFCMELSRSGIPLNDTNDQMLWSGGDCSGYLTVKNVYAAITNML